MASRSPMPLLNVYTSAEPPDAARAEALLKDLSSALARALGKPEAYVMTNLVPRTRMTFGGTLAPACYAELKNVGTFSPADTARLSAELTDRLARGLGVEKDRIYVEFSNAEGHLWGWNGETF
jgi:phenylpyruvate tautomerase